jgi:hypothetical protein
MRKPAPRLEWEFAENEADWERRRTLLVPDMPSATSGRWPSTRSLWGVAALLLLLASVGGWWWHTTQGQTNQAAAAATFTAQQALAAVGPDPTALVANVQRNQRSMESMDWWYPSEQTQKAQVTSSSLPPDWWYQYERASRDLRLAVQAADPEAYLEVELQTVEVQSGRAVARVVALRARGAPAYRQTRFYRHTPSGWMQMAPEAALWGPAHSLTTPSFVYHFRQHDAQAVIAVASQIDALYTTLWRNFGLPIVATQEKLVINVSVTQPPGQGNSRRGASNDLLVPSPAVYWAPVELTDGELLAQSIALPLVAQVVAQASAQDQTKLAWQPLLDGLSLWQVWDLDLPLAAWRVEVVQWLYRDLPATLAGQSSVLPDRYPAFCVTHQLWMPSPLQLHIPLQCARPEWEEQHLGRLHHPLRRLDLLTTVARPTADEAQASQLGWASHPGQVVALATLVEYAVATYGRERLPVLLAGLGQYESWDTLLPAVYDVSAIEFEVGWQAYLTTHYNVSPAILMQ